MSPVKPSGDVDVESLDCESVCSAATLLGLREFDYFRLAYRRWFGEQPYPDRLERAFVDYMLQQRVPPWVRMLTWQVMAAERTGSLSPTAFGAERYRDRPCRPRSAPAFIAGFTVVWLLLVGALVNIEEQSLATQTGSCGMDTAMIGGAAFGNAVVGTPVSTDCR